MSETEVQINNPSVVLDDLDAFASDFFGEKKAAEPPAKVEVEQEPNVEAAEPVADAQSGELTDQDEAEAEAVIEATPRKSKVQERIDELVRQREEAKREADAKIEALKREFEEKLAAIKPPEAPKPAQTSAEPDPNAVNENGEPVYELGEFDPKYVRDLTRYTLEQERAVVLAREAEQRIREQQQAEQQALQSSWQQKLAESEARYPDIRTKGQELMRGFTNLQPDYAEYLATVLQTMDHGPDVLYYLSNHPDEARQIVNSGAQKATLALGRIEAKFIEAEAQKAAARPKVSKAPPPPTVGARGTSGAAMAVPPDTDDLDAFSREFFSKRR